MNDIKRKIHILEHAKKEYLRKNYNNSCILLQKLMEQPNDPEVLFLLGNLYADYPVIQINDYSAQNLLQKSSDLGYLPATYKLSKINDPKTLFYWRPYENKDTEIIQKSTHVMTTERLKLLERMSMQGELSAMYELGSFLLKSRKFRNDQQGAFWIGRAAQKGHVASQYKLASLYYEGIGVKKDTLQAVLWYQRVANQGLYQAMFELAKIYSDSNDDFYNELQSKEILLKIQDQYPFSLILLSKILMKNPKENTEKAKLFLQKAISLGVKEGCLALSQILLFEKNYDDGIPLLKTAAEDNILEAIVLLADLYYSGVDIEKDINYASFLYNKAAEMGDTHSQYRFACILDEHKKDFLSDKVLYWFKKSANCGNPNAMFEYACKLKQSIGTINDLSEIQKVNRIAIDWLEQAANLGSSDSEFLLFQIYEKGDGVSVDINKAINWCKIAADHGNIKAQLKLAQMYDKGYFLDVNLEKALSWYKTLVDKNNPIAMYYLGMMYLEGRGVVQNPKKSFNLFSSSSNLKYLPSIYQQAYCYYFGIGCEKNLQYSIALFIQSSEQNYEKSIIFLGEILLKKDLDNIYVDKVVNYLRNLENNENSAAMFLLSQMYMKGIGVTKNIEYSISLLKKSASLNNKKALYELANIYFDGNYISKSYKLAISYLKKSAELDFDKSLYKLGVCYRDGIGVLEDYSIAFNYFYKSAELGYVPSYLALGKMYENGIGVMCDYQQAINYYGLLANGDNYDAYTLIANIYLNKMDRKLINVLKATEYLEKGVNKGNVVCLYELALLFLNKDLEIYDETKGRQLMTQAADLGSSDAQFYMGYLIIKSEMELHYTQARNYLQSASRHNNIKATTLLALMVKDGKGGEKNILLATDLFMNAARRGDYRAQYEIAKLFAQGDGGVPYSALDAYLWSSLAYKSNVLKYEIGRFRDSMLLKLTYPQLKQAQVLALEYFRKFSTNNQDNQF
ncbi:MAG: tetratricopeptide repeat protein [Succinivibrionaceae bacterium]